MLSLSTAALAARRAATRNVVRTVGAVCGSWLNGGLTSNGATAPATATASFTVRQFSVKTTAPVADKSNIESLFESMEYGPAPESAEFAHAWLDSHNRHFGMFINNEWVEPEGREKAPSVSPATGETLCTNTQATEEDVDQAVAAAQAALPGWSGLPGHVRARHLYSIARHLQKHHRLMAVVESLDNGKSVRETRDADVPLAIRHFYSHAGWAQLMDTELPGQVPLGVVGQIIPWNFPLLMLAWKVAPAIAMGNTLVIKPAPWTRLAAWLFAEICVEAGLPPGVVNIVTGDNDMAQHMAEHPAFAKVAFTGSTPVGKALRRSLAGTGRKISLELGGKSPVVVFDTADLDSAVEGLVNGIWFNQGQVCCAASRLLVQESVADRFVAKLKDRMATLRLGHSLDKAIDMGAVADEVQRGRIQEFLDAGIAEGAEVFQAGEVSPALSGGAFIRPTLVTGVQSTSRLVQEEIFGPVLVVQTFRSPSEAVALANNSRYGLSAGVWSESIGLALETAISIRAGVVWVNCHNMFDAAAGFGGYKESGFGREGGKEGLYLYSKPAWQAGLPPPKVTQAMKDNKNWGKAVALDRLPKRHSPNGSSSSSSTSGGDSEEKGGKAGSGKGLAALGYSDKATNIHSDPALGHSMPSIDRTPKMYIGGAQKRPDTYYSLPVVTPDGQVVGQVGDGSRKDIRDAVEAAHSAAGGWGKRAAYNRSQILYYIAENLSAREVEFADMIALMTGGSRDDGLREVEASIARLFTYAAWADKYGGTVQETPLYGLTAAIHEPVGVIGMVCPPAEAPLLGFVSLVAPAVVRGNTVVACPSEKYPLAATDLYQVLDTSDLPGGVINIVTGQGDVMAKTLAEHQDVDSVWYFGSAEGSYHVERLSADNVKRTFVGYGRKRDWYSKEQGEGLEFLQESIEVKNVWVPMGDSGVA